jgi:hypothetical protein
VASYLEDQEPEYDAWGNQKLKKNNHMIGTTSAVTANRTPLLEVPSFIKHEQPPLLLPHITRLIRTPLIHHLFQG